MLDVGDRVKLLREHRGMTQRELAEAIDAAVGTIQQYEGHKRKPRVEMLLKLAEALQVPLTVFTDAFDEYVNPDRKYDKKENEAGFIRFVVKNYPSSPGTAKKAPQNERMGDSPLWDALRKMKQKKTSNLKNRQEEADAALSRLMNYFINAFSIWLETYTEPSEGIQILTELFREDMVDVVLSRTTRYISIAENESLFVRQGTNEYNGNLLLSALHADNDAFTFLLQALRTAAKNEGKADGDDNEAQ